ncbi:MAG TPA: hypothetical protein VJQ43_04140 [Thermoplasmata archaeon]|nr:hypothetical protein [Thermoplasmata archaeon]
MASAPTLPEILRSLGDPPERPPAHPVQHGAAGTLLSLEVPGTPATSWRGIWLRAGGVDFLGDPAPPAGLSRSFQLSGDAARLADLLADVTRRYVDTVAEVDARLAALQSRGREVPTNEVWALQREVARLRAMIGRAIVVIAEVSGPSAPRFPGAEKALAAVEREVDRARELAVGVQQSLSDLILLRNSEESNRIAEVANALSKTSNRIAELANISNIRMLGITYIALVLGLVSAVVLIPNTAATILGMPSAAWVPGVWVDVSLVVLAVVPIALVFSRPWVRRVLSDLASSEKRTAEGLEDLPEIAADGSARVKLGRKPL